MNDQAEGLRRWAERQALLRRQLPPRRVLMLVGEPARAPELSLLALGALQRWQASGHQWVGDPRRWQVVPLAADAAHLQALVNHQKRWGLWVDNDLQGARRAYLQLRQLRAAGGPRQLLVLHPGCPADAPVLNNLRAAAARFLGVRLVLVEERAA